jgi:hypothetical protein
MTETEKLRALLAEVLRTAPHFGQSGLYDRIDAVLAEPVEGCARCETLRELADTAAAEQGLAQRRMMEAQKQREALARIEQAPAVEPVEWTTPGMYAGSVREAWAGEWRLIVERDSGSWIWYARRHGGSDEALTEDEAKAAAERAAGVRP